MVDKHIRAFIERWCTFPCQIVGATFAIFEVYGEKVSRVELEVKRRMREEYKSGSGRLLLWGGE